MAADYDRASDHFREALRLEWLSRRVPVGTLLLSSLLGASVLSILEGLFHAVAS
jgi:hypothetical protein